MARKGWEDPPPVALISGTEDFLRRRALAKAVRASAQTGRRVEWVTTKEEVEDALTSGMLYTEPLMLVVGDLTAVTPEEVTARVVAKSNTIAMVLVHEGDVPAKLAPVMEAVPKTFRFTYTKPPPYKATEQAIEFVVQEAERLGKKIPEPLAKSLVDRMGADLGLLSYEMLKVSLLLDARSKGTEIKGEDIAATMVLTQDADIGVVVDAVGARSVKGLLKALDRVKSNWPQSEDPTLAVVAWVGNRATTWLHAATLDAQGSDEREGANRVEVNPYVYTRFVLPVARQWKVPPLVGLLQRLAVVERAAKTDRVSPWTMLECALIASIRSADAPR